MDYRILETWVNINSGSSHLEGLRLMAGALEERLSLLPGKLERLTLPPASELDGEVIQTGDALRLRFRPKAPLKILFSGHMDTVFGPHHPFQAFTLAARNQARGPGVADMKGGLLIMIEAVERFLNEDRSGNIGGELLITGDEEIGSPGSRDLIREAARSNHLGLVFESSLPGGELVCRRMGTGTFRITAQGRSAHTGRDFANGRNAVVALSSLLLACHALNTRFPDARINVGRFNGGGPVNVVPDQAEGWLNIRTARVEMLPILNEALEELTQAATNEWEGIRFSCVGEFTRPPKEESAADAALHDLWNKGEARLGLPPSGKRETGGSSDGNLLGEAGLPHLDGVGIRGGHIHSDQEFAFLDSIEPQIDKTLAFMKLLAEDPCSFIESTPMIRP